MYKITILGDIMLKKEMMKYNYQTIFKNVKEYLAKSDYIIANIETPISKQIDKEQIDKYSFVAPKSYIIELKKLGINMLSTANNHCLDNGKNGIYETIDILDELEIEHIGTYKNKNNKKYIIKNIENRKVAFLANTYGTNAFNNNVYLDKKDKFHICLLQAQELNNKFIRTIYNSNNFLIKCIRKIFRVFNIFQFRKPVYERNEKSYLAEIEKDIKIIKEKEKVDYIIMIMHDGGQNNESPIKRTEINIKYMKNLGVIAIIVNHEHMIHKVKLQKDGIITYSLGNFIGINGILEEPFDKMQDYSIGINMYFYEGNIKYTFTIFKVIYDDKLKCITVNTLYDLIKNENNIEKKKKLIEDNNIIVNKVLKNESHSDAKLEYEIGENKNER